MKPSQYIPGSDKDFERLYRDTYGRIVATLQTMVSGLAAAEDCAQETFVNAYRAWRHWRPDAPAEVWLHRIAIHTAITYRRREWVRRPDELIRRIGYPSPARDPANDDSQALLGALRRLPPELSAVIVLRYVHGYTNREIAAVFNAPESTIGYRLAVAKKKLAAELAVAGIEARPLRRAAVSQMSVLLKDMSRSAATPR
jgi:RNA polymerase sigma-70 factor, ECF subfamily